MTTNNHQERINQRVARCEYLHRKLEEMIDCGNMEQAEAYAQRINRHLIKLYDELENLPDGEQ